jgi:hypothetical protein
VAVSDADLGNSRIPDLEEAMQKLVTVRLREDDKLKVEEHVVDYLKDGWRITSIAAAGGGGERPGYAYAWVAVVLEKGGA